MTQSYPARLSILMVRPLPSSPLFPYTTLFRSSSYFATFRHQLTILSKTDALDEEKWLNMLGTFVKDWFRYESHFDRIDRKSGSAGMPRPISYAVFCLKKKIKQKIGLFDE